MNKVKSLARRFLPKSARRRIVRWTRWPPVGWVSLGSLRRLRPISAEWGTDRGTPIDRYYIEGFLNKCQEDIHGVVLEIGTDTYTRRFGGDRVVESAVLHVVEQRAQVTIIGDLTDGGNIADDAFDCVILTQTLNAIFNVQAALHTVYRILKPGGVALITVPGISKISRYDMDRWGYFWAFTSRSVGDLLRNAGFGNDHISIQAFGNVLTSIAFLHGIAHEELGRRRLDYVDPDYELLITARAVKPEVP